MAINIKTLEASQHNYINHLWGMPNLSDVLAGLSLAGILLPESVAYAGIAGLPPIHALLGCLIGLSVYAIIGSSRQAIVSPMSSAAVIFTSAAAVNSDMGFALMLVAGLMFIVAGLLKVGFIGSYISRPVMQGFAWSLAITIMLKQLPHLLGIETTQSNFFNLLLELFHKFFTLNITSTAIGVTALVVWLILNRLKIKYLLSSLVVLVGGTVFVGLLGISDTVKLVGVIPLSNLGIHFPQLTAQQWISVCQLAPALLLIIFAESWESVQMLSSQTGEQVNPNRELVALGLANMLSGAAMALPVGAGFSASNASLTAGAASKWAGMITAISLALLLLFGRTVLSQIPIPVLAAVVLGILSRHLFPKDILKGIKLGADAWLAIMCVLTVLFFGVLFGMTVSVGVSLLLAMYQFSKPLMSELGQLPDSHDFVDVTLHPNAIVAKNMLIVRPEEPIFFANAERIFDNIISLAKQRNIQKIIISMEASDSLDTTTLYALQSFVEKALKQNRQISLARVKDNVRARIADFTTHETMVNLPMFWSVDDAFLSSLR